MKKLQLAALLATACGLFVVLTSFAPEKRPVPGPRQGIFLANHQPVATRCVTAAGVAYAVQTVCVPNPGSICRPSQCPNGPIFGINRRPLVFNCTTTSGIIYAFGNTCAPFAGAICQPNACP